MLTTHPQVMQRSPATLAEEMTTRTLTVRADSIDEAARSVEAVLATENPVAVLDMESFRIIDEILLMSGADLPQQLVLLESHARFDTELIRGSVRELRVDRDRLVGRISFARDEDSERAWGKVRDGHLTDVSVGYRSLEWTDIAPGLAQTVAGRSFTNRGQRTLRVTTKWRPREVSLVAIGADEQAKMRGDTGDAPADIASIEAATRRAERERYLEQSRRTAPVCSPGDPPVGIVRDRDARITPDVLAASICLRGDLRPRQLRLRATRGLYGDERGAVQDRIANQADELCRNIPLVDVVRLSLGIDGHASAPYNRYELFPLLGRSMAGSAAQIFTTVFEAALMAAFQEFPDTTRGWTSEEDVPNFQPRDLVDVTGSHRLEKLPRGGTAKEAVLSALKETYKIARYARSATLDEQDVVDDRFDALTRIPQEMGRAAARLRPDLVYSILLANAALDRDGVALFHADHGNLIEGALSLSSLSEAIKFLAAQQINGVNLNLLATHLIVPQDLKHLAVELTKSPTIVIAGTTDVARGNINTIEGEHITPVADNRIGVAGVTDPDTGIAHAGGNANWFLAAARQGPTIKVGYLEGAGREPEVREYALRQGEWGMGWDVEMDIGAKAEHYATMVKSSGDG